MKTAIQISTNVRHVTKNTTPLISILVYLSLSVLLPTTRLNAQTMPGIPEPGLVMYGSVSNSNLGMPVTVGNVNWIVSGGGSSASVSSLIVNVNGQYFYIARIPFETRSVSGINLAASPNTLPLTDDPATSFTRSATVLGTNAVILGAATFNFGKADRGKIEQVNLSVNLAVDPAQDTDGDGVPDWQERIAGTDPNDPNSVFKASTDVEPASGGGLTIRWSSVPGKTYAIHRATSLDEGFVPLETNLSATAPQNQYTDTTATGPGPYFYRISTE